jgi:hypothetical protein
MRPARWLKLIAGSLRAMRLLGLAQADPTVPITGSGATAKCLFDALARRHELVHREGVDLTRFQRVPATERAEPVRLGSAPSGEAD